MGHGTTTEEDGDVQGLRHQAAGVRTIGPAPRWRPSPRGASPTSRSSGSPSVSGSTKGSFYWHFKDHAALIVAALERWEADYTDGIIADRTATTDGPVARFRALLAAGLAESAGTWIDANLATDADDPSVADALRRVSAKRLAFVDEIFAELRSDGGSDRALLAFCAYLGMTQLQRIAPQLAPGRRQARFVDHVVEVLTTGRGSRTRPAPPGEAGAGVGRSGGAGQR